ncbi:MAG TPA: hypothetical protein VMV10_12825 [Pirellulales bacterium]|nr:hypothetical protein [Pirellulales bacterium]
MFTNRIGACAAMIGTVFLGCLGPQVSKAGQPPELQPVATSTDLHEAHSLDSPAWRETLRTWNEWLLADRSYVPDEAERLHQELDAQLAGMSSAQLADFKSDLDAKLALLMGPTGREYRLWVNETLAVASEAYARKVRAHLPDFAHMSASEVQTVLDRFQYDRYQAQQRQEAYRRLQQQRIAATREELYYQREASDRALARAGSRGNMDGHFAVPPQHQPHVKKFHGQYGYGYGFGFGGGIGFPIFFW